MDNITALDLLAANAPEAPAWFEPNMRPEPVQGTESLAEFKKYDEDMDKYYEERERQRLIQWPYAYADMVLAQRIVSIRNNV